MSATETPAAAAGPWELLGSAIANLASRLNPDRIGAGPLAELRRMDVARLPPPAFWRLLLEYVPETLRPPPAEPAWALLIGGMARMARKDRSPHAQRIGLGAVLAETDYAEPRLVRLLRADSDALVGELRAVCMWLDTKGRAVDWTLIAELVLGRAAKLRPFDADCAARQIARDYFGSLSRRANTETKSLEAVNA